MGFYVLLLFDIVLCIQVENLTAITESEQTMAAYLQNSFFSAGYLMAASIVALKCLNLVPDLAAWMIPEGDTAFSTRNFGEGVAQQAKISTQGMLEKPCDFDPFGQTGLSPFGYNMIDPLKSWCWGSILFYPFKISRFS